MSEPTKRSRKKSKDTLKQMKIETNNPKTVRYWESIPRGKFTALQAYFKKQEKTQINNLTLHLKELEKE